MKVERSPHVVLVLPPAVERAGRVWELVDERTLVVCADHEQAAQWASAAPPPLRAHAVTGLARTAALLTEGRVGLLAGAPADLGALVARAALKLDTRSAVVIAWPEGFAAELDTLLAEAPQARRIVLSWNPPALSDWLERHARRAEIVGSLPLDSDGRPLGPVAAARYAVVAAVRREPAVRQALDALRAVRPYIWRGGVVPAAADTPRPDAVICAVLPDREELPALAAAGAAPPVVLVLASQLGYLRSIATLTPLSLPSAADRAQDRAEQLRARIAARLDAGDVDAELALLQPLFESRDPAEVAAAILALFREPGAGSREPIADPESSGWTKLFVTIGRKDRAAPKDLVGALIREAGLEKGQIGRIEMKETFSLVDIAPAAAEQAARRLTGVAIRGRRITARLDRTR